ncbi:hypothetical protein BC829DRAFT_386530 [Chytridium lagenaria]|nr:hypothetical protein BC829DRAFT_386530 [Chytridium lagenaria]
MKLCHPSVRVQYNSENLVVRGISDMLMIDPVRHGEYFIMDVKTTSRKKSNLADMVLKVIYVFQLYLYGLIAEHILRGRGIMSDKPLIKYFKIFGLQKQSFLKDNMKRCIFNAETLETFETFGRKQAFRRKSARSETFFDIMADSLTSSFATWVPESGTQYHQVKFI